MDDALFDSLASDGFGYWLAGLMDGEGCFQISPNRPGFACRFGIALRCDDTSVLEGIRERTGFGRIVLNRRHGGGNRKPVSHWRSERKADCLDAVLLFQRFPLRSKKARDFAIWREAVFVWNEMGPPNGRARDWSAMSELRKRLRDVRLFEEPL